MTAEERVWSELRPGETVLWCGAPQVRSFCSLMIAHVIFGLIPFAFGCVILGFLVWETVREGLPLASLVGWLFRVGVGLFFAGLGVFCFLAPWKMSSRIRQVFYALTDQRAIVVASGKSLWNPVPPLVAGEELMEFSPEQIRNYQRKWQDFGRTDIVFHKELRKASRRKSEWWYFGFIGVDDPAAVERVIQEQYLAESDAEVSTVKPKTEPSQCNPRPAIELQSWRPSSPPSLPWPLPHPLPFGRKSKAGLPRPTIRWKCFRRARRLQRWLEKWVSPQLRIWEQWW